MTCRRCGVHTPRLTVDQTRCTRCESEVTRIIELDSQRRTRFPNAKELRDAA